MDMSRGRGKGPRIGWWLRKKQLLYSRSLKYAVVDLVKYCIAVAIVLAIVGSTVGTGVPAVDQNANAVSDWVESAPDKAQKWTSQSPMNESAVETEVIERINDIRSSEGANVLRVDSQANWAAAQHARDMAEKDYLSHKSRDGETVEERYSFCAAGENIAQTWANKYVEKRDGDEIYRTESELAAALVEDWMNSRGHRKNILDQRYRSTGVAVAIRDDGKVFAVQAFCQ